ncbi:MAG: HEAT repeat domain-containing protein [Methylocella sp.]
MQISRSAARRPLLWHLQLRREPLQRSSLDWPTPIGRCAKQQPCSAGKIKAEGAVAGLIETLSDEAWQVRGKAALVLGQLKATGAVAALGGLLSHPVSNLRKDVVTALGAIGDANALPFLERAAEDADLEVREIALHSLQLILSGKGR